MNLSNLLRQLNRHHRFIRFLCAGGLNFAVTYGIYAIFVLFFSYPVSYSIAYFSGIILAYFLNKQIVFNAKFNKIQLILFPMIYLMQYFIGLMISILWVDYLLLSKFLVPVVTTIINIPITYLLMKGLFYKVT